MKVRHIGVQHKAAALWKKPSLNEILKKTFILLKKIPFRFYEASLHDLA